MQKQSGASGNAFMSAQTITGTETQNKLNSALWDQEHLSSHLNFHCNCNQWLPSNVIYVHSILMGSVLKEIGVKQPVDTNKDKKRDTVRRKLTLHGMPLQTAFGQKQRIRFDKA